MSRLPLCFLILPLLSHPDRPAQPGDWGYRPVDGTEVSTNPPSLTWIHQPEAARYTVQWAQGADFAQATTIDGIRWCVYTHSEPLKAGEYFWRFRPVGKDGTESEWSQTQRFTVPASATIFPKPPLNELLGRVPASHPRLFVRPEELPQLRQWARTSGRSCFEALLRQADQLLQKEPTPEPAVRGGIRDEELREHWWPNRVQTLKACQEAEVLAFAYLLTQEAKYASAARRWILHLASWDPDGPTNFALNCEAAKPLLHRLPRAYDWAFDVLTEEDRRAVREAMRRRATDAWVSWEVKEGNGHLTQPYGSHANRTWHKLAECGLAFLGEIPEAEVWIDYAVNKFFAAYPVWSDDDGGWHEGLSYWGGYMSKVVWWTEAASKALGIDSFQKPFFHNAAEYALYTAPPGSPDMGFGDQSYRPPQESWSFVHYIARKMKNPIWAWWAQEWKMRKEPDEPVIALLWGYLPDVKAKPPIGIPPSKVFRGTGVAVLNTSLQSASENVQFRLKSSPFGRQSHGHDPHNSFTLIAYGEPLLVNNVYRDWHGSPFHTQWCWSTHAQNALLVDGQGQKKHSPDPLGKIIAWDFKEGADYVAAQAAESYEGKLKNFIRHVLFIKPDVIVIADEIEAAKPSTFQWMLHGQLPFELFPKEQVLTLKREKAAVRIHYLTPQPVKLKQWTGYDPPTDLKYLAGRGSKDFPPQWHVEAALEQPTQSLLALTVLRIHRSGEELDSEIKVESSESAIALRIPTVGASTFVALRRPGAAQTQDFGLGPDDFALAEKGRQQWRFKTQRR